MCTLVHGAMEILLGNCNLPSSKSADCWASAAETDRVQTEQDRQTYRQTVAKQIREHIGKDMGMHKIVGNNI